MTFAVTPPGWRAWVLAHPRNLATCPAGMDFRLRGGEFSACLRSFPFRKELGRPSLLRSADVTSKAKGWSSLPVLWFVVGEIEPWADSNLERSAR